MQEERLQTLEEWKRDLEKAWLQIPKPFRNDHSVRRTLQCRLYRQLIETGYHIVADYMPPRIKDREIDLIVVDDDHAIVYAICIDTVVTLAAVKSLSSFEAANKVIFTTGLLLKKVQESRFFLKPEIEHVHLQPFEKPYS
ncbi:MAG TPA: hypothetical protein PKV86_11870 [Syntrophobacteraceae bacterium]|nr:hypothetical protein [Syntrophobacteraceae bacterium]